jgi:hypothetical protein
LFLCGPPTLGTNALTSTAPINLPATLREAASLPDAGTPFAPADALVAPFLASFPSVLSIFRSLAFPFPLLGAVHVRSAITLRPGAPPPTASVALSRWDPIARAVPRGVESDVTVSAGAWTATHTFLFVGAGLRGAAAPAPPPLAPPPAPPAAAACLPLPLEARSALPRAWAAVTGDFNPIHTSAWAARCFGFSGRVAHGMSVLLRALRASLSPGGGGGAEATVRFLRPLLIPDGGASVVWWDEEGVRYVQVRNGGGKACIAAAIK